MRGWDEILPQRRGERRENYLEKPERRIVDEKIPLCSGNCCLFVAAGV